MSGGGTKGAQAKNPGPSSGFWPVSPFSSTTITFQFAEDQKLNIHQAVLERCPALDGLQSLFGITYYLEKFPVIAGHSLFHYLYTGQYDPPLWAGPPDAESSIQQLKVKFRTYGLARKVRLDTLETLVREDIEAFAEKLDMFAIMEAVKGGYPVPIRKDPWFHDWVKRHIKTAFAQPKKLVELAQPQNPDDDMGVAKVILGCMLETYADMMEALANAKNENAGSDPADGITGFDMMPPVSSHDGRTDDDRETSTTEPFEVVNTPTESLGLNSPPASDHEHRLRREFYDTQQAPFAPEPELEAENNKLEAGVQLGMELDPSYKKSKKVKKGKKSKINQTLTPEPQPVYDDI
ncbi:uncharacterized protein C8A04DRAFT_30174 [Dichotomopilus funicola]|uniref:BTB domain-containing protein n=1 Tax=Dichotomopilus funicola TaxID=1934379 RepID=A0AAN6V184_9PEZI|nr:hypothetical protein C8A04DRAFT_30174 [Dichotomopilus funicola]